MFACVSALVRPKNTWLHSASCICNRTTFIIEQKMDEAEWLTLVGEWVSVRWCFGSMTFSWQCRRNTCVVSSCYFTVMSQSCYEEYSACGVQQGAGRAGSRCVNTLKQCVSHGFGWHDLPVGEDTSLAENAAVQRVHCWLCMHMWESNLTVDISHQCPFFSSFFALYLFNPPWLYW